MEVMSPSVRLFLAMVSPYHSTHPPLENQRPIAGDHHASTGWRSSFTLLDLPFGARDVPWQALTNIEGIIAKSQAAKHPKA